MRQGHGGDLMVGSRIEVVRRRDAGAATLVDRLVDLAPTGLARGYLPAGKGFAQTVRAVPGGDRVVVAPEGSNLRYAAMAALGLARTGIERQHEALAGDVTANLVEATVAAAVRHTDPGAVALAAWAGLEIADAVPHRLLDRLAAWLRSGEPLPTVDVSWMLVAGVLAASRGGASVAEEIVERAQHRLLEAQGAQGIFPHGLPASSQPRWRAHVGSFADQVYPIQSLARSFILTGDKVALDAANRTAARICELQGDAGQWWWHYDAGHGGVVEHFPVYSVHQHAMAPMVLFDLLDAGGDDHVDEIARGLTWLDTHPEVVEELVSERYSLIWRKVGRREPRKAARALNAASTAAFGGARVPGLDRLLPAGVVDHECRPYELGWLLYAWLPAGSTSREERS